MTGSDHDARLYLGALALDQLDHVILGSFVVKWDVPASCIQATLWGKVSHWYVLSIQVPTGKCTTHMTRYSHPHPIH